MGSEELYEIVPQKLLPVEYGGENGTIPAIIADMEKKLFSYREHFLERARYGIDEYLREDDTTEYNDYFGTDGSFRKLSID